MVIQIDSWRSKELLTPSSLKSDTMSAPPPTHTHTHSPPQLWRYWTAVTSDEDRDLLPDSAMLPASTQHIQVHTVKNNIMHNVHSDPCNLRHLHFKASLCFKTTHQDTIIMFLLYVFVDILQFKITFALRAHFLTENHDYFIKPKTKCYLIVFMVYNMYNMTLFFKPITGISTSETLSKENKKKVRVRKFECDWLAYWSAILIRADAGFRDLLVI